MLMLLFRLVRSLVRRRSASGRSGPPGRADSPGSPGGSGRLGGSGVALVVHQLRYDLRSFLRNKQARFTTLALPPVLLVAFVSIGGGNRTVVQDGHTIKVAAFYVPGLIAYAVTAACFTNLVLDLVRQRESGVLKRRRATPVPAWALIGGRTATSTLVALATTFVLLAVGGNAYGVTIPSHALPGIALTVVFGSAAFCAVSYALVPLIRSSTAIQPVLQLILLPLLAISGVLVPDSKNPAWLRHVASVLPLEHVANAFHKAFEPGSGLGISGVDLLVLAVWTAAALAVAVRRFSWLPVAA